MEKRELITSGQAGKILGVSSKTILNWCIAGKFKTVIRLPSGHTRLLASELEQMRKAQYAR